MEKTAEESAHTVKDGVEESIPNMSTSNSDKDNKQRRPAKGTEPFEKWERDEMEKLLGELCGHLGAFCHR